jgi:hypothetical protein
MARSIMAPFSKFPKEGDTIGRLLAGYSNIDVCMLHMAIPPWHVNAVVLRLCSGTHPRGYPARVLAARMAPTRRGMAVQRGKMAKRRN